MATTTKPEPRWLISWIGQADLDACEKNEAKGPGPVLSALTEPDVMAFDCVLLLSNYDQERSLTYCAWLKRRASLSDAQVNFRHFELNSPIDADEIYPQLLTCLSEAGFGTGTPNLTYHLNPGTTMMGTLWVVLSRTLFPGRLIQTAANQKGPIEVKFPTDVSSAFLPALIRKEEASFDELTKKLVDRAASSEPVDAAFERILYRSEKMRTAIDRARQYALYGSIPVLILGETGTGKEEFARAIHKASPRADGEFIEVNCGALTSELMGSELFGHKKGAFTGATTDHVGKFQAADGGTIFLDEVGELSADAQVRLLRVLQEKSVVPLGSNKPVKIDARIIAATHRNLTKDVAEGKFREDLFFRLNVGVFTLPPLREREGDLEVLCEIPIREYNEEVRKYRLGQEKQLSPEAKLAIARHDWPGNVREMFATILRAALWSKSDLITAADVESAMIQITPPATGILDRPMKEGFKLEEVLNEVSRHYIERALNYTKFNKTKASRLLGFANYQRLDGWTERLGLTNGDESE